jgi:hypothetical protein
VFFLVATMLCSVIIASIWSLSLLASVDVQVTADVVLVMIILLFVALWAGQFFLAWTRWAVVALVFGSKSLALIVMQSSILRSMLLACSLVRQLNAHALLQACTHLCTLSPILPPQCFAYVMFL